MRHGQHSSWRQTLARQPLPKLRCQAANGDLEQEHSPGNTMITDFRVLCAELMDAIDSGIPVERIKQSPLAVRVDAALAQPEPVGPTDEELTLTYAYSVAAAVGNKRGPFKTEEAEAAQLAGLRAVLERWGRPAITPIPVNERLPGPGDCNAEGRCWLLGKTESDWRLISVSNSGVPKLSYCFSHWLPFHALPLPAMASCG
jgi:hypothetical protein